MKLLPQFTPSFPGSPVSWRQEKGDIITSWFEESGYFQWQIIPQFDECPRLHFNLKNGIGFHNIWEARTSGNNHILVFDPVSQHDFNNAQQVLNYLWKDAARRLGIDKEYMGFEKTKKIRCNCKCHTTPGLVHCLPCCDNGWIEVPDKNFE